MRLLVYTPTYSGGLLGECRASMLAQQYSGAWEWVVDEDDPFPAPDHRNVLAKYQRAQRMALDLAFDALVTVEHDMVLPPDALAKLTETRAPVVYGTYMLRHGSKVLNVWRYEGEKNLGQSLSIYPRELELLKRAKVGRVSGTGWGCTLIRRSVLEMFTFHDGGGANPAGDLAFSRECLRRGIKMAARFDVPCGHIDKGVLLQAYDEPDVLPCVALQDFRGLVQGRSMAFRSGERYLLPDVAVREWVRAGYVRASA